MSDQEHKEDVDKVTEDTDHTPTGEETPLTGEEVTLPGEASAAEDIVGGASVTETSQVEPVHMGVTPTSVDDALAQRSTSEHSEAEPEERNLMLARVLDGADLSLNAAVAEAPRHEDPLAPDKELVEIHVRLFQFLRIDPCDFDLCIVLDTAVMQCLRH